MCRIYILITGMPEMRFNVYSGLFDANRAEEEDVPFGQIIDDECRQSSETAQLLTFADLKNTMHKRRRLLQSFFSFFFSFYKLYYQC